MKTQTIEVEVPDGYRVADSKLPGMKIILSLEKIQPRRIVLEDTEEERSVSYGDWFEDNDGTIGQWPDNQYGSQESYKVWREVKETDEPKLSLSVGEAKTISVCDSALLVKLDKSLKENS